MSAGTPIHVVSGRVGHAKASTTNDVYSQFLPTADSHAADTIGQVLHSSSHDGHWTPMDTDGHHVDTNFGVIGHIPANTDGQSSDSNPMSNDDSAMTRNSPLEATREVRHVVQMPCVVNHLRRYGHQRDISKGHNIYALCAPT